MASMDGYDVKFVKEPPMFVKCPICICTLKDAVQVKGCGHQFCKLCIQNLQKDNRKAVCSVCQEEIDEVFDDQAIRRTILDFIVICRNKNGGCSWTGALKKLEDHINFCRHQIITCTYDGCLKQVKRHDLRIHKASQCQYRNIKCQYCFTSYVYISAKEHKDNCNRFPLVCLNKCGKRSIPKDQMKVHIQTECPNQIHHCKYENIGCKKKGNRASLQAHMNASSNEHLSQAIDTLENNDHTLKERIKTFESKIDELEKKFDTLWKFATQANLRPSCPFPFVVSDFNNKLSKNENDGLLSQSFYCLNGYSGKVNVKLNRVFAEENTHVGIFFYICKGQFDDTLDWPFKGNVKFTAIDNNNIKTYFMFNTTELSNDIIESNYKKPTDEMNGGYGYERFIAHKDVNKYVIHNTMTFIVDVTPI